MNCITRQNTEISLLPTQYKSIYLFTYQSLSLSYIYLLSELMDRNVSGDNPCQNALENSFLYKKQYTYSVQNTDCLVQSRTRIFIHNYNNRENILAKSSTRLLCFLLNVMKSQEVVEFGNHSHSRNTELDISELGKYGDISRFTVELFHFRWCCNALQIAMLFCWLCRQNIFIVAQLRTKYVFFGVLDILYFCLNMWSATLIFFLSNVFFL